MKRRFSLLVSTVFMVFVLCINTFAGYYVSSETKTTTGGTAGTIDVKTGTYIESYDPYPSVHVPKYGGRAEITTSSTLLTNFIMYVTLYYDGSTPPTSVYLTGNVNHKEHTVFSKPDYGEVICSTSSDAFGSSYSYRCSSY